MPDYILAILLAVVEYGDGGATLTEIIVASGYLSGTVYRAAPGLLDRGWIARPSYGRRWFATERGKIAVAIEVGRRAKAVAGHRMKGYKRPSVVSFDRIAA